MLKSDEINEISKALVKAQSEMGSATKGSENPFYKSKYADLSEVISVVKDPLNSNGITFLQPIGDGCVKTLLIHESGQWIQSIGTSIILDKQTAQAQGSGISYARRYDLQSMLSIPAEDDDGNGAMPRPKPLPKKKYKEYQQNAVDKLTEHFKGNNKKIGDYLKEFIGGGKNSYDLSSDDCDCIINDLNSKE